MRYVGIRDKKALELQKLVRGFSNKHRVRCLFLLSKRPEQSISDLAEQLDINFRTASEHARRMYDAGLITKAYAGNEVIHRLTPLGEHVLRFLRSSDKYSY